MADLMSDAYSYDVLCNKYGNFIVPAYQILVNGTDVVGSLNLTVAEMVITLSLNAASSVLIKLDNLYDEADRSFNSDVKTKFKLGTVVEIEIGYLSETTMVFKGFVAGLGVEFDEYPLLVVQLMDVRRLMMTSGKKHMIYQMTNYSDVFKEVMSNYLSLCSTVVDATSDSLTKPISQTTNDYNFVTRELIEKGKAPREFFVVGDKAYFREVAGNKTDMLTVTRRDMLLSFSMMSEYLDTQVVVTGYDPKQQTQVLATADAKNTDDQTSVISTTPKIYFIDPDADSVEKAATRADAIALRELKKICTGSGTLLGLPEMVPGRFLKVDETDVISDKSYYIVEVVHTINSEYFRTYFEIGGCG